MMNNKDKNTKAIKINCTDCGRPARLIVSFDDFGNEIKTNPHEFNGLCNRCLILAAGKLMQQAEEIVGEGLLSRLGIKKKFWK